MGSQAPMLPQRMIRRGHIFSPPFRLAGLLMILHVLIAMLLVGCGEGAAGTASIQGKIVAVGSTALQPLINAAAPLFQKKYPQAQVIVQGGGSIFGLNAVNNHQADIGDSDLYADPATFSDPALTDHLICAIPFTIVVGSAIPVTTLTHQQIIDIFSTGKIRNWKQLGGPDLPVVPVIRPATSGTRAIFRKYILGGLAENGTLLSTDSSQSVRDKVANTPGAIGYLALSVLDSSIHTVAIDNQTASPENIEAGHYTFWGYEHMYTLGSGNAQVASFLNFMLTPEMQQLAKKMNYIPISEIKVQASTLDIRQHLIK